MTVGSHRGTERHEGMRLHRYVEQSRGEGSSLTDHIAVGPGCTHRQGAILFVKIARRSLFGDAPMPLVFEKLDLVAAAEVDGLFELGDRPARKSDSSVRSL